MKRKNIAIAVTVIIVLIVATFLVATIARLKQPCKKVDLSAKIGLNAATVEEKDIQQKRKLIWGYHDQGNKESTVQAAEEYLKLVSQDEDIWIILAENYMWSDKLTEAEQAVKEALQLDAKSAWGLRTLAAIYRTKTEQAPHLKQEYLSKAQLKVEEALEIDSNDPWVNIEASKVYLAQGKGYKALQATNKALELRPDDEYFLNIKEKILSGVE